MTSALSSAAGVATLFAHLRLPALRPALHGRIRVTLAALLVSAVAATALMLAAANPPAPAVSASLARHSPLLFSPLVVGPALHALVSP